MLNNVDNDSTKLPTTMNAPTTTIAVNEWREREKDKVKCKTRLIEATIVVAAKITTLMTATPATNQTMAPP